MLVSPETPYDMFAGKPGKAVSRRHGAVFIMPIISGWCFYWPFTRRLNFGTIQGNPNQARTWLDWHNSTRRDHIVWAAVVSGTGVINTWAEPMLDRWRTNELASMAVSTPASRPRRTRLHSNRIVDNAQKAAAGMEVAFIAFPGTPFSSSIISRHSCVVTSR